MVHYDPTIHVVESQSYIHVGVRTPESLQRIYIYIYIYISLRYHTSAAIDTEIKSHTWTTKQEVNITYTQRIVFL